MHSNDPSFVSGTPDGLLAVEIVAERYALGELIGGGATADVYAARHVHTGREHAVKRWRRTIDRPSAQARWKQEIFVGNSIRHQSILCAFDAGVDERRRPYVVMDRLYGEDLAARLERGPLSLDEAQDVFGQLIDGLAAAHRATIIHRDLRPANVFLQRADRRMRVRLLDFGFARILATSMTRLTGAGVRVGTFAYMAPEQLAARDDVGPPADVWAFGVLAYQCLTGRRPFQADTVDALASCIRSGRFTPLDQCAPHVPHVVAEVIERCLSVPVERRFRDAASLQDTWSAIVATRPYWTTDRALDASAGLWSATGIPLPSYARSARGGSLDAARGGGSAHPLDIEHGFNAFAGFGSGGVIATTNPSAEVIIPATNPTRPAMMTPTAHPPTDAIVPATNPSASIPDWLAPSDLASTMRRSPHTSAQYEARPIASRPESGIRFTRPVHGVDEAATKARVPATFIAAIAFAVLSFGLLAGRDTLIVPLLTGSPEAVGGIVLDHVWTPAVNITAAAAFVAALVLGVVALVQALRRRSPQRAGELR